MKLGFIGLGSMGEPMALNVVKAGLDPLVWNRGEGKRAVLASAGARIATSADEVFSRCDVVILMLANAAAIDAVLGRGSASFATRVAGRTLINMGTNAPSFSKTLETDIRAAGGHFIEAPVSGSRAPATAGQLVAMVAGDASVSNAIRSVFAPMCRQVVDCGAVPSALLMKLAVNVYLITTVTGLAEATNFARREGLDLEKFVSILNAGPMASDVSRVKTAKLLTGDFSKQAGIIDVLANNQLIVDAAREAGIASPLVDVCRALYAETASLGLGEADMIAVIRALENRSA